MFNIKLDNHKGYQQIFFRKKNQVKLSLFTLDEGRKTFNVSPFGPNNTQPFYTERGRDLQIDLNALFDNDKLLCLKKSKDFHTHTQFI